MISKSLQPEDMSDKDFIKALTLEDLGNGELKMALPLGENVIYRVLKEEDSIIIQAKTKDETTP